jgi:hypothetical protein
MKLNLYRLHNGLGDWYVVAEDPTVAQKDLEGRLNLQEYGFSNERKTTRIDLLARELGPGLNEKWFFCSGDNLLLPEKADQNEE